jgi:hypothetical protein
MSLDHKKLRMRVLEPPLSAAASKRLSGAQPLTASLSGETEVLLLADSGMSLTAVADYGPSSSQGFSNVARKTHH